MTATLQMPTVPLEDWALSVAPSQYHHIFFQLAYVQMLHGATKP